MARGQYGPLPLLAKALAQPIDEPRANQDDAERVGNLKQRVQAAAPCRVARIQGPLARRADEAQDDEQCAQTKEGPDPFHFLSQALPPPVVGRRRMPAESIERLLKAIRSAERAAVASVARLFSVPRRHCKASGDRIVGGRCRSKCMSDKQQTQAMPDDNLAGTPDGTENGGRGGGGDSGGGPYPNPLTGKKPKKDFEGGQSDEGYHGSHQLGS